MSPSPAPQLIDDSLDTAARPSSHSPEPLDAAQVEAMRKRAVELSLQGKMSMSAKEKELAIMVLRLTSCSVPDVSQILAQADTISDLTRQRDFLYKEIEEERARWEAEKQGFERIAEALIGKRSRGGDSTYREEELERHVAILDADNKALRSKISEYHARMQTVEAELAQLRPVLLMQPFALTHTVQHTHTQPASYTFVGPSYKAERSSKRRKHAQPPPQATDRDQDATEEEGDDAGPSTIATPKQRPQKGDYYRRRDTDVFTETTKHRRHRPKKGSSMLADARAEHLLLAARKVGKERAAILAGIASGPERDRKKEDDSTTATPRTPKRSQVVPVTGGTMGIMYLNSPAPAPATPAAAPAASTSQPMQTPQPASRTVATQKAPAPDRPAVTNPRTPLDSLLTAARSISMIEDEDDDAEEEEYDEPAAGPSNLTKPLTRGRVAELQGSPVSVKRRRVAAPLTTSSILRSRDTGAAARKNSDGGAGRAEETTRRTRSGLDVLADQAAAAFSSEKDKSTGRGKGKGKAKARDVSEDLRHFSLTDSGLAPPCRTGLSCVLLKSARRARSRCQGEPLQAPAAEQPNNKTSLPADLAHTIVAHIVGDFFQDIILDPKNASEEDVIGTMLHVSRAFREFTIKFLRLLWGDTFFIGSTLTNYKSAICILRELATAPYQKPHKFVKRVSIPALNSRVVRRRSGILIDLALYLLDGVAYREMGRKDIGGPPIGVNIFDPEAVSVLRDNYHSTVPSLLRPLLLGRVWDKIVKWAIIWPRGGVTVHLQCVCD
ncbi:hypothetical protein EWM64_g35 [Hericium alpestre]|uniref:Uncharacterized protein n=1 Tax=Hericium alpestre TaxID=135208 RepID=A0A4Z0ACB7_9AGAM|nr:hypothetical protein EWM64_g35 [Hericium alpestre]